MRVPFIATSVITVGLAAAVGARAPQPLTATAEACEELRTLVIPNVTITSAQISPAATTPARGGGAPAPATCRVAMMATPTSDSQIRIEVWIPVGDAWNGKLLGTGNGGFGGAIGYPAMTAGVARGYATAGTDAGHTGDQLDFGAGHPEKIVDWAHRAIHVMTEHAKLVIRNARGRFPTHAYFDGCSTGGQQALSEAQRYPRDYDGIVAGDPGHNRVRLILGFLWSWMALHDDAGRPILPAAKLPLLTRNAVAACDAADGLKDSLLSDTRGCTFDPATLLCKDGDTDSCLTQPQVDAVKKVYGGAKHARTHAQLFPGWAPGTEQGWGAYLLNPTEPARTGFFRSFAFGDPKWDWRSFDWDRDVAYVDDRFDYLSALSTDLRAFQSSGGRLVMYTGLADPVVPAQDTIAYYEAVAKTMGGIPRTQEFFRFFPVPGMGHCNGGAGPSTFDALAALEQWVEHGVAPAQIAASHSTNGVVDRTRPLCPYPAVARYKGTGREDDAANFSCATPAARGRATTSR